MEALMDGRVGTLLDGGTITDEDGFAQDIIKEVMYEDDEGDTPLYRLLEDAIDSAVESGSAHVRFGDE